jgi:hypothetical protein
LSTTRRYLNESVWKKHFGITLQELDQLTDAVATALDGRIITREELMREVARITGSAAFGEKVLASSWGAILKPAAFTGRLCFGPSLGQRVRFTRPDTWLRTTPAPVDLPAATAEVTRRFLAAYGPATHHDLARRFGGNSSLSIARQWIRSLADEVTPVEIEGVEAWMLAAHAAELADPPPDRCVRLLPGFDQYVVAASCHVRHLMPGDFRARVFRPQGWISPVLLVNGRILGTWRHTIKGSRLEVAIEPFTQLPAWVRRAAKDEAERLAAFFGCTLLLQSNPLNGMPPFIPVH